MLIEKARHDNNKLAYKFIVRHKNVKISLTNKSLCDIFKKALKRDDTNKIWYHRQAVRQRSAKPLFPGSNPGGTSNSLVISFEIMLVWRNGRRTGLKIPSSKGRVGSSPTISTTRKTALFIQFCQRVSKLHLTLVFFSTCDQVQLALCW